jgi:hypothetical protein
VGRACYRVFLNPLIARTRVDFHFTNASLVPRDSRVPAASRCSLSRERCALAMTWKPRLRVYMHTCGVDR